MKRWIEHAPLGRAERGVSEAGTVRGCVFFGKNTIFEQYPSPASSPGFVRESSCNKVSDKDRVRSEKLSLRNPRAV